MDFFKKKQAGSNFCEASQGQGAVNDIKTAYLTCDQLDQNHLEQLCQVANGAALVIGFISPDSNIDAVAKKIHGWLPNGTKFMMISTAGELCNSGENTTLYQPADENRNRVLLQAYSKRMVKSCQMMTLSLPNDDLRQNCVKLSAEDRVAYLQREMAKAEELMKTTNEAIHQKFDEYEKFLVDPERKKTLPKQKLIGMIM